MPWHSYFIEAMPFTASAVPMLFVAARASGQPTRTHKPIICQSRRLYGTQGTGAGRKMALAISISRRIAEVVRRKVGFFHCESVGLGHGFTMDEETEEVKDGLAP